MYEINGGGLIEVSVQVGAFVLLAWLVRRVFQHTIPRLSGDFKETLLSVQKIFTEAAQAQREDFKEELRAQREDFKVALQAEREYLGKRIDRLADNLDELLKELRKRP